MTLGAGRRSGLTFPSLLRPVGAPWLRLLFGATRRIPLITDALRRMEVIHVARWAIVERLPGATQRLPRRLLLSLFDYDGDLLTYIDVFAASVPWRFRGVWSTSYGYPGLIPTDGFNRWVHEVEPPGGGHYFAANDGASVTMIGQALRLQEAFAAFRVEQRDEADDEAFAAAFWRFATETQPWL